jgi:hypothetical protein
LRLYIKLIQFDLAGRNFECRPTEPLVGCLSTLIGCTRKDSCLKKFPNCQSWSGFTAYRFLCSPEGGVR